ncbi:hypothetical protein V9T40_008310 [Parthenolecanium corni]|uniref:Uncharacterized protein n=1 Tax=Parthenolecanium corni TaxID=536013 RepID=A0AAN9TY76_9HEMI
MRKNKNGFELENVGIGNEPVARIRSRVTNCEHAATGHNTVSDEFLLFAVRHSFCSSRCIAQAESVDDWPMVLWKRFLFNGMDMATPSAHKYHRCYGVSFSLRLNAATVLVYRAVTLICLVATVWARLQSSRDRGIPESWFGRDTFFEDEIGGQEAALERQDQEEAATNEHHHGRVQIKVYRGPDQHDEHEHFAPYGYWVKQPADHHHRK